MTILLILALAIVIGLAIIPVDEEDDNNDIHWNV